MDAVTTGQILAVLFFAAIIAFLMFGYVVAWSLGGLAVVFGVLGWWVGAFDPALFAGLSTRFYGTITNPVLIAVPLFVFMGVMLERSRIAEVLLTTMGQLFGDLRGGLGISVVIVGALLAASTGIVGATVVTMGLLSLPAMMRAGYDPKLATGVICASGTLGQIIPPSTVLIFLADILQGANSAAQMQLGNFTPDTVSVGDLFAGAFLPGITLAVLYGLWVVVRAVTDRNAAPALGMTADEKAGLGRRIVVALIPPITLIVAVLGSIISGVATPTESASVGSLGAILLAQVKLLAEHRFRGRGADVMEAALFRFWLAFLVVIVATGWLGGPFGLLTFLIVVVGAATLVILAIGGVRGEFLRILDETNRGTLTITSMVFIILLGATAFALVFTRMGGAELVANLLEQMPGGQTGALIVVMAIMFVLGFFLDTFEIVFIVVPITAPILLLLGMDPILLGVLIGINLQTSFLTPPFGFSLFYLRGVAPPAITTPTIYRGAVPFVAIQIVVLASVWAMPQSALWLPNLLFRNETPAATAPAATAPVQAAPEGEFLDRPEGEFGAPEVEGEFQTPRSGGGSAPEVKGQPDIEGEFGG